MPLPLLPIAAPLGFGTAATGAVGVGASVAAATAATSAISLSTIASWGLVGGSFLYGMLDTPKGVDGPRLTDFTVNNSQYGLFRSITWGSMRVDGNIIWSVFPVELEHTNRTGLIFKTESHYYEYYGNWAVGLGESCGTITRIWLNNQLWFDLSGSDWREWIRAKKLLLPKSTSWEDEIRIYTGSEDQLPDDHIESYYSETGRVTAVVSQREIQCTLTNVNDNPITGANWYAHGSLTWKTGNNIGEILEVQTSSEAGEVFTLRFGEDAAATIGIGDTFSITARMVPAFRGEAYILFKNILLSYDFGNAIPSCSAEKANGAYRITDWDILANEAWDKWVTKAFVNGVVLVNHETMILSRGETELVQIVTEDGLSWTEDMNGWTTLKGSTNLVAVPRNGIGAFVSPGNGHSLFVTDAVNQNYGLLYDQDINTLTQIVDDKQFQSGMKTKPYQPYLFPRYECALGVTHNREILCVGGKNLTEIQPEGHSNGYYRDLWTSPNGITWTRQTTDGGIGYRTGATILTDGAITLCIGGKEHETASPEHNAVFQFNDTTKTFTKRTSDLTGMGQNAAQVLGACMFRDPSSSPSTNTGSLFTALVRRVADDKFILFQSSNGVTWKPMTDLELPILAVNPTDKTFTLAGDRRTRINNPGILFVDDSTGNDGEYTIADIAYDGTTDRTTITVDESIPSTIAGGNLRHYPMKTHLDATGFDLDNRPSIAVFWDEIFILGGSPANRIAKTKTTFVSDEIPITTLVQDICERCGIAVNNVVADSLMSDTVTGHAITGLTSGKDHILPLQRAFFFDIVCFDRKMHCLKRGRQIPIAIEAEEFGVSKDRSASVDKFEFRRLPDLDLPRYVDVVFHDIDNDFQSGTKTASRNHCNSDSSLTENLPIAIDGEKAKQIAEVLLWDAWAERNQVGFNLSYRWSHWVPGDVVSVSEGGVNYTFRLTKVDIDDLIVRCQAVPENTEIYDVLASVDSFTTPTRQTYRKPGTVCAFLDIPDVKSVAEDDYGFWFAAGPSDDSSDWPSCGLRVRLPDASEFSDAYPIAQAACLGNADGILPAPVYLGLLDRRNTIDIHVMSGTDQLQSITEESLLSDGNLALLGNEIFGFAGVESLGNNRYRLSTLSRGLYGTEWAVASHEDNERFVLLNHIVRISLASKYLGVPLEYQVATLGESQSATHFQTFTCRAMGKKPYAPTAIEARRFAQGAWLIQWLGRGLVTTQQYQDQSRRPIVDGVEFYEIDFIEPIAYPVIQQGPSDNTLILDGDHAAEFQPREIAIPSSVTKNWAIHIQGIVGRNASFTVGSAELVDGKTVLTSVEPLGILPNDALVYRVLHTQEQHITQWAADQKAFFVLPVKGSFVMDAYGMLGLYRYQYGQEEIYGGITDSLFIKMVQISQGVGRGFESTATFTV